MVLSSEKIKEKISSLQIKSEAFINGQYVSARSGKTFPNINPANGQILANVAACAKEDIDHAVHCARLAFESGIWAQSAPSERKKVLLKFADLIEQHCTLKNIFQLQWNR